MSTYSSVRYEPKCALVTSMDTLFQRGSIVTTTSLPASNCATALAMPAHQCAASLSTPLSTADRAALNRQATEAVGKGVGNRRFDA